MDIQEKKIELDDVDLLSLLGYNDKYLQLIENKFHSIISVRGNNLFLKGDINELFVIEKIFKELTYILKRNGSLNFNDVTTVLELFDTNKIENPTQSLESDSLIYFGSKEQVRARNKKQLEYFKKVQQNDLVFSIGPAGTGKTYLAVAMALASIQKNEVAKIILSRPAVEAGESLGFLPGDLREKLDPYLRPLTDALFDMLAPDKLKLMMEKNIIEIIPLAYMRGRTLNNSFIILDEAQNATITQMKMFLTRLGTKSKTIVTGDITQVDLFDKNSSGLVHARDILSDINGIEFIYFENKDIVRHRLVAEIIRAYEIENQTPDVQKEDTNSKTNV